MAELSKEELIELGKKLLARQEKEAKRTKANNLALSALKEAHKAEFDKLYASALKEVGLV